MVAFGFSAGDFTAAIGMYVPCTCSYLFSLGNLRHRLIHPLLGLIAKIDKALRDADGASFEYQQLDNELHMLKRILSIIEALEPNDCNSAHINAIRCLVLARRLPLDDFLGKIEKYQRRLGPFSKRGPLSSAARKSQRALFMTNEVSSFRALIAAKAFALNTLLLLQNTSVPPGCDSILAEKIPESQGLGLSLGQVGRYPGLLPRSIHCL